jgi:flagellar biosynthetic protein FliR
MISLDFSNQLSGHVFQFLLVFARMGAGMMLFPGIGESFVPARLRLVFAMALSVLVYPALLPGIPAVPTTVGDLALLLAHEVFVGLFFGSVLRLMMDSIETAGSIIAVQIGLSNAMILNPTQAAQSALPSALLSMAAISLLFVSGLDYFLLRGLIETYHVFPIKEPLMLGDAAQTYAHLMTRCFMVGVEIGAPFLVIGLLLYLAMGMIQRMMPQVQLFLVIMPLQIWGGMILFAAVIASMAYAWLHFMDDAFANFLAR